MIISFGCLALDFCKTFIVNFQSAPLLGSFMVLSSCFAVFCTDWIMTKVSLMAGEAPAHKPPAWVTLKGNRATFLWCPEWIRECNFSVKRAHLGLVLLYQNKCVYFDAGNWMICLEICKFSLSWSGDPKSFTNTHPCILTYVVWTFFFFE